MSDIATRDDSFAHDRGSLAAPRSAAPKLHREGTHRVVAPEATIASVRRLMPVFGITRLSNVTGLDSIGIPVVMACRPNARSLAVAGGKGLTLAAAKASALMESVEGYHAEGIQLPLKLASYNELRFSHPVVDVAALPKVSVNSFAPNLRLLWIEGRELSHDEPLWLPFELVHLNYTLPLPSGSGVFLASSNGLASGNHLLEAVSHGICEVVERDALTLFQLSPTAERQQRRLDPASIDDPACLEVLARYQRASVDVAIWDMTSDVGIPAFNCIILDHLESPLRPLYPATGAGCHPARGVALLRALTEAAQSRLIGISGARDDLLHGTYGRTQNLDEQARVRHEMQGTGSGRSFRAVPTWEAETLDEDVAWELGQLRAAGIRQVAMVDLTRPEFGIPVVRVVIPGLEGLCTMPGYVPGVRACRWLDECDP